MLRALVRFWNKVDDFMFIAMMTMVIIGIMGLAIGEAIYGFHSLAERTMLEQVLKFAGVAGMMTGFALLVCYVASQALRVATAAMLAFVVMAWRVLSLIPMRRRCFA